jgi:hypothetical protein
MPVIVVGADSSLGRAIVPSLAPASGEIRLFVSDPGVADQFRRVGKVAVGDISDGTHVGGAAIGAFCAVLIAESAHDERERHFADSPQKLFLQWADGLRDAGVSRIIFVADSKDVAAAGPLTTAAPEFAVVAADLTVAEVAARVSRLEQAQKIS